MGDGKIQWHPGFVAAVDLELGADREHLTYEKEYNLNRKPLQIDLLVLKEDSDIRIENEIGRLFLGHNLMEYKSPQDRLDVDTFYKVQAYACLYKAYGKNVDDRKLGDITVSLVREARPVKLFRYFQQHAIPVTNSSPGIYRVSGGVLFPTQIIVTGELPWEDHVWLRALSDRMAPDRMKEFWEQIQRIEDKYERELADAVLEVCTQANWETIREIKGGGDMCQAMLELMAPEIEKIRKETAEKAAAEATRKAEIAEEAAREAKKSARKAIKEASQKAEKAANKEALHTVKSLLKSGKLSAEEIAKCVPRLPLDEIRRIAAGMARA